MLWQANRAGARQRRHSSPATAAPARRRSGCRRMLLQGLAPRELVCMMPVYAGRASSEHYSQLERCIGLPITAGWHPPGECNSWSKGRTASPMDAEATGGIFQQVGRDGIILSQHGRVVRWPRGAHWSPTVQKGSPALVLVLLRMPRASREVSEFGGSRAYHCRPKGLGADHCSRAWQG